MMFNTKPSCSPRENNSAQLKKRLLVVGSFKSTQLGVFGGVARSCQELIASEMSERYELVKVDSTQRSNPPPNFFYRLILSARRFVFFIYSLFRYRPDGALIFCSDGWSFFEKSLMCYCARLFRSKSIIFPRAGSLMSFAPLNGLTKAYVKILLFGSSFFLAQGKTWSKFAESYGNFTPSNIVEVPNWTALEEHLSVGQRKILGPTETSKVTKMLFIGWLEKEKGVFELIEVARRLNDEGYDFELIIAGDGSAKEELKDLVQNGSLCGRVIFPGWVTGVEKDALFEQADIFVLPSWSEGFPNALIEGMSFALCPVVTNVGVISDFLVDGVHAKFIPPKDISTFKTSLSELLDNSKLRRKLGTNAYNLAVDKFSKDRAISLLIKNLDKILN